MRAAPRHIRVLPILALGLVLGAGVSPARADHAQPFGDSEFPNATWLVRNYGNRTASAVQVPGGVSGNARQVTHPLAVGSSVQACHIKSAPGTQIDPANGAIMSLDCSIMAKFISGVGVNGHQFGLALTQGGIDYRAGALATGTTGSWVQLSLSGLKDTDFARFDGQPGTPDFSTAGEPISFGFRTGNGSAGQTVNQIVLYDDLTIVIHRGSLIFTNESPSASDWNSQLLTTGTGGTFTRDTSSNGNPGSCELLEFKINAGSSSLEVLDVSNSFDAIFDPQFGAIDNIEISMDFKLAPNSSASPMTVNLLLEQDGVFFQGPNMSSGTSTTWRTVSRRNLVPAHFTRVDEQPGQPDFSTSGKPITIGRRAYVSHPAGGSSMTFKQLVDNFHVRAHFIACPCDFTGDNLVDDSDFGFFVVAYNILDCAAPEMEGCSADLNGDEVVDDADFQQFIVAYNQLLCP